jgi:hypothetical protein
VDGESTLEAREAAELPMLSFLKHMEGKKYGGKRIGAKPVRAISRESAERMILEGKAIIHTPKPTKSEETP